MPKARTTLIIPPTPQPVLTKLVLLRNRTRFLAPLVLLATLTPGFARSKPAPPAVDTDYVRALFAANDFLHAWQVQDREAGILLLTDRLKQRTSEIALMNFFSSPAPCTQSFEIQHGKKLAPGRYRFPISLFQHAGPSGAKRMRPQTSSLVVVKTGKTEWSIDKLP